MHTTTFYSYRGGVGRTTCLVNVGVDLALRGRKVLLVDFDLEAPGLQNFALLRPKHGTAPGLVEFIDEYLRSGKTPDIADYIYEAKLADENGGKVWVMPAGRGDTDYWRAFHQIDWKKLYDNQDGFVLFEDLKFQWWKSFEPDYVLIDARAGINDRLPICRRQLPDALVMFFTPDILGETPAEADQAGFQQVLESVVMDSLLYSSPPRIDVLPVAVKVPDLDGYDLDVFDITQISFSNNHGEYSASFFSFALAASIPHAPELLLERKVVVGLRSRKRLPQAYRRLANALIRSNCCQDPEGARAFLKELQRRPGKAVSVPALDPSDLPEGDLSDYWSDYSGRLDQLIKNFDHDAEILAEAASCLFLAGRCDEAMSCLDRAIELGPTGDADRILWQRASYSQQLKLPRAVDDLFQLLTRSAPSQKRRSEGKVPVGVEIIPRALAPIWRNSDSTELDTIPINTADQLITDFSGIDPYVASAFQRLLRLAPDKIAEVLETPRIQQLSQDARQALIDDKPVLRVKQDPYRLIAARQWRSAISVLDSRLAESSSKNPQDLFLLAMACWGAGDETRATELCRLAKEAVLELESDLQKWDSIQDLPLLSLMFWKAGDSAAANQFLDRCDELLSEAVDAADFFSVWRFQSVTRAQFERDCQSQRQMIKGAAIPPYFLEKKAGAGTPLGGRV